MLNRPRPQVLGDRLLDCRPTNWGKVTAVLARDVQDDNLRAVGKHSLDQLPREMGLADTEDAKDRGVVGDG